MATAKTPAKKAKSRPVEAKKPATKAITPSSAKKASEAEKMFDMPKEVKDWIDQAMSRMRNLQSKVDRLEEENKKLKAYRRWAEQRIVGTSHE